MRRPASRRRRRRRGVKLGGRRRRELILNNALDLPQQPQAAAAASCSCSRNSWRLRSQASTLNRWNSRVVAEKQHKAASVSRSDWGRGSSPPDEPASLTDECPREPGPAKKSRVKTSAKKITNAKTSAKKIKPPQHNMILLEARVQVPNAWT